MNGNGKDILKTVIASLVVVVLSSAGGWLLSNFLMGYKVDELKEKVVQLTIKSDSYAAAIATNKSDIFYLRKDVDAINNELDRHGWSRNRMEK